MAMAMASNLTLLIVVALVMLVSSTVEVPPRDQKSDLIVATEEMQRANYFTFVVLIKMAQFDERFQRNVTFLMPNDRMLSRITLQHEAVTDFLLRHSIPSPLLFNYLERIPTGSMIPSSLPEDMLRISNNGTRNFFVNSVKLISPNICTAGSYIRCHGIDGVLLPTSTNPSSSCPKSSNIPAATPPPSASASATTPTPPPLPSATTPNPPSSPSPSSPVLAQEPTGHYVSLQHSGYSSSTPFGGLSMICITIASIWVVYV